MSLGHEKCDELILMRWTADMEIKMKGKITSKYYQKKRQILKSKFNM